MNFRKVLSTPARIFSFCCLLIPAGLCYAGDTWQQLVSNYSITAIEPYEGGYWFSADGAGALRYETASGTWYRYNKASGHMNQSQNVNDLKIMHGRVWFATDYGLYSCKPNGSDWQQHILPGDYFANWVRAFDANTDYIWIASFSGLYTRPASGGSFTYQDISVSGYSGSKIAYSVSASDSVVWIGTDNGLIRHDTSLPVSDAASRTYIGKHNGFNTASQYVSCRAVLNTASGVWIGLEEYTPASTPDYCLGGLFWKRGDDWLKYDQNNGLPAPGIHFIRAYGEKIYAGLFHYLNGVYFNGAGLLEMDPQDSSLRVLSAGNWHIGNNDVRAFYVSGTDTLVGTEQGLYTNIGGMKDMTPYDAPEWFFLRNIGDGEILINIGPVGLANGYRVYYSTDHTAFDDSLDIASVTDTIRGLTKDRLYYFRVAGTNNAGAGPKCDDVLAAYVADERNRMLIVQAFNRKTVQNTYDYVHQHGTALLAHGHGYDAVSDNALEHAAVSLGDYEMVDWIAGTDETNLNTVAKQAIGTYLMGGGKLFISGSNLQENLSGTGGDPYFYKTFLKAESKKANIAIFSLLPFQGGMFNGFDQIPFGEEGTAVYRVYRPDGFIPADGAVANLMYTGLDSASNGVAGLQYTGTFATSSEEGAVVYLGFPFETIHGDSLRGAFMGSVLHYFGFDAALSSAEEIAAAPAFELRQNYPNPFNAETRISYVIPADAEVSLDLYDVSGRKIRQLVRSLHPAGEHTVNLRADDLPAGVYIYMLRSGAYSSAGKMILLK